MGVDAEIYFETKDGEMPELEVNMMFGEIMEVEDGLLPYDNIGCATHCVSLDCNDRYYGDGYERGHWCALSSVLMLLHASEDVVRVWYGVDHGDPLNIKKKKKVLETSLHFMLHGNRPYRRSF